VISDRSLQEVSMDARVKALGHPVHPMLVMFPGALFVTGTIFDTLQVTRDNDTAGEVGFWTQTAGLAGGSLAAATGFADWTKIPRGTRARRIGRIHGWCNATAVALFGAAWATRSRRPSHAGTAATWAMQLAGVTILGVSAWLGGELVDRMGVGVSADAHPDAPSSLSLRRSTPTDELATEHTVPTR
jgi:uncharacterized membrane protein